MNKNLLQNTLNLLFRNEERRKIAKQILETIKNRGRDSNPYSASERLTFSQQNNISITKYDSVLGRLKRFGLMKKEGSNFFLSEEFSQSIQNEWFEFLKT